MSETRDISIPKGAKFERVDGEVKFTFVIDAGNIVGPRLAKEADKADHPEAWAAFCASEAPPPPPPAAPVAAKPKPPAPKAA